MDDIENFAFMNFKACSVFLGTLLPSYGFGHFCFSLECWFSSFCTTFFLFAITIESFCVYPTNHLRKCLWHFNMITILCCAIRISQMFFTLWFLPACKAFVISFIHFKVKIPGISLLMYFMLLPYEMGKISTCGLTYKSRGKTMGAHWT